MKPQKRAVMGFAYAQNLSFGDSLLPEDDPKLRRFFFPWSLNRAQGLAGQGIDKSHDVNVQKMSSY